MLSARDLTLRRGPQPLIEQINFTVFRGDKVGVTGANGSGKSSLFAAIRGELIPDRGDIDLPAAVKIAHVEQEIAASSRPAIEFVLDGDAQLRGVQAAIEDAEKRDAALVLADLYASLESIDGYRAKSRAAAIMHGLGFKTADHERAVTEFSGGWRVRLAMAARCVRGRTCCCWMNPPITWISMPSSGWRSG
jgi:ATP-binding cassette, subfamily F, member 3